MKNICLVLVALIMSFTLMSGFIKVNVSANSPILSEIEDNQVVTQTRHLTVDHMFWFHIQTVTDLRLRNSIGSTNSVRYMIKILQEAREGDIINFHIAGYGGEVETVTDLINAIKQTKAHTVMIVEAPSYSGHAYIALFGNELIMRPYSFLMYHTSSALGEDCSTKTGTDRGVSNVEHCEAALKYHMIIVNKVIGDMPVLTAEEKESMQSGHDVYITADDFYSRTNVVTDKSGTD